VTTPAIALDVMSLFSARVLRSDRARMRVQALLFAMVFAGGALFAALPHAHHIAGEFGVASRDAAIAREPSLPEADLPSGSPSATEASKRPTPRADAPFVAETNVAAAANVALRGHASGAIASAALATNARGYNATAPPRS
jgi:hypothetical protein